MAKRPAVPKFGTWESDNAGYTAYFDKVRENKGASAPPLHRPFNPNDPEEGPMMIVPPPSSSSRPATSSGHGHREPQQRRPSGQGQSHHRRTGSSSSAASDPGGRGAEQSKFAPQPQYYSRPSPQPGQGQSHHRRTGSSSSAASDPGVWGSGQSKFAPPPQYYARPSPQPEQHHGGQHQHHGGYQYQQHQNPAHRGDGGDGGGGGHRAHHAQRHGHHVAPGPRARSASPQSNAPSRQRPSAVPKFGVWDEQTASAAAQGFTVQFENVKRHREVARTAVPRVPRAPSPPEGAAARRAHHQKPPFVSKVFGCFLPTAKE